MTETEELIKKLRQLNMTEDQKRIENSKELGKQIGDVIFDVIILFTASTIIWAVLTFIFALNITWIKVFGAYFLFNFFKNIIIRSFKK